LDVSQLGPRVSTTAAAAAAAARRYTYNAMRVVRRQGQVGSPMNNFRSEHHVIYLSIYLSLHSKLSLSVAVSTVERKCSRGTASFHSYMGRTNVQPSQIRFAAWPEPRDLSRDLNCAGGTSSSLVKGKVTNTVGVEAHGCEQLAHSRRTQQSHGLRIGLASSWSPV